MNSNRVESIFSSAIKIPSPVERAAYLDQTCGADQDLRKRIEALLEAQEAFGSFMNQPAVDHDITLDVPGSPEGPGATIGHYKLLQRIGEGGFGVVYMAQQQEPIKRRVALKIIKLGMDTKQVIGRFEAERQALAMMDHPNIAKVLDAGATESGRPYFVMELVRGVSITQFCDENKLSAPQRLELFIPVCQAIQHAHQKAIIHRDIKPSNVLVTMHDDRAVPKVIDFGIAKATQSELTARTVFTEFQQFIGTPAYMSPEQAQMSGLDIDTRCDVYALGVLLYELLTGSPPFDPDELRKAGYDEIRRRIREEEPPKPSTRVSTLDAASRTSLAHSRKTDADSVGKLLRGDLDWIIMKAMEKDRTRRYETANGLALDVRRFLSDEPVSAVAPSSLYRLRKFARRNRATVLATAAFVVVLILGAAIASWQAYVASFQRDVAQQALSREKTALELARENETEAQRAAERSEALRYIANMNLLPHDWERTNISRVKQLLDDTQEYAGRGFEWYYWQRQLHDDLRTFVGHTEAIWDVAFSPDENLLATAGCDSTVKIWDIVSGEVLQTLRHDGGFVRTVEFSREGDRVLTAGDDTTMRIWDTDTGAELQVFHGHAGGICSARFSPSGQRIVTGGADGTAKIWDYSSKEAEMLWELPGHVAMVWGARFSPDGRWVATAAIQDSTVRLWSAETGELMHRLTGHSRKGATRVAFSPDNTRIVTGDRGGAVRVWNAEAGGEPLLLLEGHSADIWAVAYSPDGRLIVSSSNDQTARIWDATTGVEIQTVRGHATSVSAASFSPSGRWIATGGFWEPTAKLWEVHPRPMLAASEEDLNVLASSPDGTRIISADADRSAKVLFTSSKRLEHVLDGHPGPVLAAAFSQDDQWLVTGSVDRTARIWDATTGEPLAVLEGHASSIRSVAVSLNGQRILTGGDDQTAILWDASTYKELQRFVTPPATGISDVAIAPDGAWIVTAGDQTIVWDTATGKEIRRLETDVGSTSVAVSPDGRYIAAGTWDETTGYLWDADTGKERFQLKGHTLPLTCMAFSPDGTRLVTGAWDGAKLWDTGTGRELLTFEGHAQNVEFVRFSFPNGRQIVTSSSDRTLIWEAASPEQVRAWKAEEQAQTQRAMTLRRERDEAGERDRILRQTDEGYIRKWLMMGPIPLSADVSESAALGIEPIPEEHQLRPTRGDRISVGEREFAWRQVQLSDAHFSFVDEKIFGPNAGRGTAYAVCYVRSDRARRGLRLKVHGGDPARIYLNQEEVHKSAHSTWHAYGDDVAVGLELKEDLNVLVFKSVNQGGHWLGGIRFTTASGDPVPGIDVLFPEE